MSFIAERNLGVLVLLVLENFRVISPLTSYWPTLHLYHFFSLRLSCRSHSFLFKDFSFNSSFHFRLWSHLADINVWSHLSLFSSKLISICSKMSKKMKIVLRISKSLPKDEKLREELISTLPFAKDDTKIISVLDDLLELNLLKLLHFWFCVRCDRIKPVIFQLRSMQLWWPDQFCR